MKTNIANLRSHLSEFLSEVERGATVEIQKRNVTIAKVVPVRTQVENKTKLGCGKGSVKIKGDLTEAMMEQDWEMQKD